MLSPDIALKNMPEFSLLIEDIWDHARVYGYQITYSPLMEKPEILMRGGAEVDGLTFNVMKRGDKLAKALASGEVLFDHVLRYDQTIGLENLMRSQGMYNLCRCQVGPVWRAERKQAGRFKEFWQADFDVVGRDYLEGNHWVCNLIYSIIRGWLPSANIKVLCNIVNSDDTEALNEFADRADAVIDPALARGQSYYSGVVWEIAIEGEPLSIAGGGSYKILDRMASGGSLGIERLLMLLDKYGGEDNHKRNGDSK